MIGFAFTRLSIVSTLVNQLYELLGLADEPVLKLSHQIIENQGTLGDRIFSCSAQIGYPPGHLEIQTDVTGNFTTLLSPTDTNNDMAFITSTVQRNTNKCDSSESFEFALKAPFVTMALHESRMRCVVIPPDSIPGPTPVFTEKIIEVVESR